MSWTILKNKEDIISCSGQRVDVNKRTVTTHSYSLLEGKDLATI